MLYEYSERFIIPLSHDEVVHGKGSLLDKDAGRRVAEARQPAAPARVSCSRGPARSCCSWAPSSRPGREWNHDASLDWHLGEQPSRRGLARFLTTLGAVYREHACLWRTDPDAATFAWIDCADREASIVSYQRRDGDAYVVVVLNLTPVPRQSYRIGIPRAGRHRLLLDSDAPEFAGSGYLRTATFDTEAVPWHGLGQSIVLALPPLGALVLAPE